MKYPETLILPILMFADYFLTVLGAIEQEKKYAHHFKMENYELNPIWQSDIAKKRWFNPRFLVLAIVVAGSLIYLFEASNRSRGETYFFLGVVFGIYGVILGRHFCNLLIFIFVKNNPKILSGEVVLSKKFILYLSAYQLLIVLIPTAFIAFFSLNEFALGGVVGILVLLGIHVIWILIAKKKDKEKSS
jgi:hypothetical protein